MLAMTGCNLLPFKIRVSNPPASSAVQVAASFDRTAYDFTPVPAGGNVLLMNWSTKDYAVRLHGYADPSRPIALPGTPSGCTWIGEHEIFTGPNLYATRH